MKLIGFAVWERRTGGGRKSRSPPASQYSVNGERRSFALLRAVSDTAAQERVRDLVLQAYAEHEAANVWPAMMAVPPAGTYCAHCHIRFGERELAKRDAGEYFPESTFKRCHTRWKLQRLQVRAARATSFPKDGVHR